MDFCITTLYTWSELTGRVNNAATQNEVDNIEDLESEQWRHVSTPYLFNERILINRSSTLTCKSTTPTHGYPVGKGTDVSHAIFYLTKNLVSIMPWGGSIIMKYVQSMMKIHILTHSASINPFVGHPKVYSHHPFLRSKSQSTNDSYSTTLPQRELLSVSPELYLIKS